MAGVGMGLAFALAAASLVETIVDSHYWFSMCRLEVRTKVRALTWQACKHHGGSRLRTPGQILVGQRPDAWPREI